MNFSHVLSLLGGVALFLFGMTLMGDGLKRVAGSKMELVLYRLAGTPLKGVLLGAGGLFRAYTKSAKDALDEAGLAVVRRWEALEFSCSYAAIERMKQEIAAFDGVVETMGRHVPRLMAAEGQQSLHPMG